MIEKGYGWYMWAKNAVGDGMWSKKGMDGGMQSKRVVHGVNRFVYHY